MTFKFKLPIQCKPEFALKPFIGIYQHDYKEQSDRGNYYQVLHLDFEGAVQPTKKKPKMMQSKQVLRSPLDKSLDQESSDSRLRKSSSSRAVVMQAWVARTGSKMGGRTVAASSLFRVGLGFGCI